MSHTLPALSVVESFSPMALAREVIQSRYRTPQGGKGLLFVRGTPWAWQGCRWKAQDGDWLVKDLRLALENVAMIKSNANTGETTKIRLTEVKGSYSTKCRDVAGCIESLCGNTTEPMPFWLGSQELDPRFCVAFQDKVVHVGKELTLLENTGDFVSLGSCPVDWPGIDAVSPLWSKCLQQWSGGDEVWIELLQRWWGYMLLPYRGYAKWMYMFGKIRAGKGVNNRMFRKLIGGSPAYFGTDLDSLAGTFGKDGLHEAQVLVVGEISDMGSREGEKASQRIKECVGGDHGQVNAKNMRQMRDMACNPAPWISGNEILSLPDKKQGLSGKMLPLKFNVSFADRLDDKLEDKLEAELPGIAAWAMRGAQKLVNSDIKERWPLPKSSQNVMRLFQLNNNLYQQFLEGRFVRSEGGYVSSRAVHTEWAKWTRENRIKLAVPRNMLLQRIEDGTTWPEVEKQLRNGRQGLLNLQVRRQKQDEI